MICYRPSLESLAQRINPSTFGDLESLSLLPVEAPWKELPGSSWESKFDSQIEGDKSPVYDLFDGQDSTWLTDVPPDEYPDVTSYESFQGYDFDLEEGYFPENSYWMNDSDWSPDGTSTDEWFWLTPEAWGGEGQITEMQGEWAGQPHFKTEKMGESWTKPSVGLDHKEPTLVRDGFEGGAIFILGSPPTQPSEHHQEEQYEDEAVALVTEIVTPPEAGQQFIQVTKTSTAISEPSFSTSSTTVDSANSIFDFQLALQAMQGQLDNYEVQVDKRTIVEGKPETPQPAQQTQAEVQRDPEEMYGEGSLEEPESKPTDLPEEIPVEMPA